MFLNIPNSSSVDFSNISTVVNFLKDLLISLWESIKFIFDFFVHVFDPTYYMSIFQYLPSPFSSILTSLVGLVLAIVLIKLISMLWSVVKVW